MAAPVETKVKASTVGAYLSSFGLLEVLVEVQDHPLVIGFLPDALEPFVLALVPAAIAFVAGWKARHTPRGIA